MATDDSSTDRAQRGIQSIEVGGQLLRALVHHGRPMALKDLEREAEMSPAKAHPYLVSFSRLGLIEQDRSSGHYLLGPLALQLRPRRRWRRARARRGSGSAPRT